MHARVTPIEASADLLDAMTRQFEQRTVPVLEGLHGYKGYILLGDRGTGLAMAVTYRESEEALRTSEDAVKQARLELPARDPGCVTRARRATR